MRFLPFFLSLSLLGQTPTPPPKVPCRIGTYMAPLRAGLVIIGLGKASPAEIAGVKVGDVIVGVDSFQQPNGLALNAYMSGMAAIKGCSGTWDLKILRDGQSISLEVPLLEYQDPLETAPFISPTPLENNNSGWFTPIDPASYDDALQRAKQLKKVVGDVIFDDHDFKGEAAKGFWTEFLVGKSIKKPKVILRFYSPKMALVDELYRKTSSFDEISKDEIISRYSKMDLVCVIPDVSGGRETFLNQAVGRNSSLQRTAVIRTVIRDGDKIVRPIGVTNNKVWFPLSAFPKDHPFELVIVDIEGAQAIFNVDPKKFASKGIF